MESATADTRVEDYLNDKLQTLADLDTLDTLLSTVQSQQSLLRSQLKAAESDINKAESKLKEHSDTILLQAQIFQQEQEDIDRRTRATNTSAEINEVAKKIEKQMEKLQKLEIAKGYVTILLRVYELSAEAQQKINVDPKAALVPYVKLQTLFKELKERHEAAEEAAIHLVDFVEKTAHELWEDMRGRLGGQFQTLLTKLGWPSTSLSVRGDFEFESAFMKLLILNDPELIPSPPTIEGHRQYPPLFPLEVMVKPLELRFRYHFQGDRQTNRIDKPEWFFNHVLTLIEDYIPFLSENIQPILDSRMSGVSRDAVHEFISAVLPMLRKKIQMLLPQIVEHAQALSHFIHEMIKFDIVLRDEFLYAPYGVEDETQWRGLTHEVLVKDDWFRHWLKVEKDFALSRYQTIVNADDAWVIDYDSVEPFEAKPTKSAIRLKDLLETITDRYRPLTSFNQRLRFLIDIQISILDQYHDRLNSSVEAFKVLSSTIARAVQGTSKEEAQALQGIGGLERLCRVLGSAAFLEECMRDWGEDVFFLELWEELQGRAMDKDPTKELSGAMTVQDVADKTSNAVMSGDDDGALFDETAGAYKLLQSRAVEMIIEHIGNSMSESLRAYSRVTLWTTIPPHQTPKSLYTLSLSPEFAQPIFALDSYLSFLSRTLTPPVFRRISRKVLLTLQEYLLDYVVNRNQFSEAGGRQFARDCAGMWNVVGRYIADAEGGTRKLKETCLLLTLPSSSAGTESTAATVHEDEDEDGDGDGDAGKALPIKEVVDRVFADAEGAAEMMEKMDIGNLSVSEVRSALRRRVEAWA